MGLEKSDEDMELSQATERVIPLESERAKMLSVGPDATEFIILLIMDLTRAALFASAAAADSENTDDVPTPDCRLDPGPSRWIYTINKIDSVHVGYYNPMYSNNTANKSPHSGEVSKIVPSVSVEIHDLSQPIPEKSPLSKKENIPNPKSKVQHDP
ncbi:hypothetical protein TNCV_2784161 [Trichonephila clavipes]|nr:hypothetical protein TNCV_2784161 [Trichonephila clavipes]